ncbi:MAG: fibronectin type III domain-containing protein [Bacteroidia bacterium]|nr:fibronectin type III domain-containing protein [Bacteroidia bacterium]
MQQRLLIVILFWVIGVVISARGQSAKWAQPYEFEPNKEFNAYFEAAYEEYPIIARGVLEAIAFTNTRIQHIEEAPEGHKCNGRPHAYGVMGLILDGKGYFRENLKLVSRLSGIPTQLIIESPEHNIMAFAAAYHALCIQRNITSTNPVDQIEVIKALSELPEANSYFNEYVLDVHLYSVLTFLNTPEYQRAFGLPNYQIDLEEVFGVENARLLSSPFVLNGRVIMSGDTKYTYQSRSNFLPDTVGLSAPVIKNSGSLKPFNADYSGALWDPTPCNWSSRNGATITDITIHSMEGSYAGSISWFKNCNANASAHYCQRASDGQITQMIEEYKKAWHVNNQNPIAIGIEREGYISDPSWSTTAHYNTLTLLTQDICQRRNINPRTMYDGPGTHGLLTLPLCYKIKGHQHYSGNTHVDPGQYFDWRRFFDMVNNNISVTQLTAPSGTHTDPGGANGNYGNNQRNRWLIKPTGATSITLTFASFATEANKDILFVYDGQNNKAPLLGSFSGTNLPAAVTAYSGAMFLEFVSDCNNVNSGWVANWTSSTTPYNCPPPSNLNVTYNGHMDGTFSWSAVSNATSYEMRLKQNIGPDVWTNYNPTTNSINITGLTADRLYQWQVRTVCGGVKSAWINAQTLTPLPLANVTLTQCNGNFNDTGGNLGNYRNNENYIVTIAPGATSLTMTFNSFKTHNSNDKLQIYNGTSVNAPLIGTYSGTNSPGTVTATSGAMTLRFTSNNWSTESGWSATWSCVLATCALPTNMTTSNITDAGAQFQWAPVPGASQYTVRYKPTNSTNWVTATTATNSFSVTNLSASTQYEWQVKATCGGLQSNFTTSTIFTTLAPLPCNVPGSRMTMNIQPTSAQVKWAALNNAVSYTVRYRVNTLLSTWTTLPSTPNTQLIITGLSPNTNYIWQVQATCNNNTSSFSSDELFTTPATPTCATPTGLTSTNISGSSATLSWNPISGASYVVEYKVSGSTTWSSASTSTNSFTLTGLNPGTTYQWQVKAVCGNIQSSPSSIVTFTTQAGCQDPNENNNTSASATTLAPNTSKQGRICPAGDVDWFKVTISTPSNITVTLTNLPADYNLELYVNGTYSQGSYASGISNETITITNAAPGTYHFRVYGQNSAFNNASDYTITATVTTQPACAIPTLLNSSAITSTAATLGWAAVSGATSYEVQYKPNSSSTWVSATATTNSFNLAGLTPSTLYDWRVRAQCGTNNFSNYTTTQNFTTLAAPTCGIPTGMSTSSITSNSAVFSWSAVTGASSYTVRFKPTNSSTWNTFSASTNSFTATSLLPSTQYHWEVKANCTNNTSSAFSSSINFTTQNAVTCVVPAGLVTNNISTSSATLAWNPVSGANGYQVRYKPSASTTWTTINVTSTSHNLTNLTSNTQYDWQVQAVCGSVYSGYGANQNFTTLASCVDVNEPNNTSTTATPLPINSSKTGKICPTNDADWFVVTLTTTGTLNVTLTNLPANFNLERFDGSTWVQGSYNTGTTSESIVVNNATPGTYLFRVYGYQGVTDDINDYTIAATFTPGCSAPTSLTASNITANSALLQWSTVSGATSYLVQYKPSSATSWSSATATTNSYTLTGLTAQSSYQWRVSATCSGGNSPFSSIQTFTTSALPCVTPTNPTVNNITVNSAQLNWGAVGGATSYNLEYKLANATTWTLVTGITTNSYALTGLSGASQYNWRVSAVCGGSSSAFTTPVAFTTLTPCPVPSSGLTTTGIGVTSATANWASVSGAISYDIRYKPSSSSTWSAPISTTSTSYTLTGLTGGTSYDWQVSATCGGGTSAYSVVVSFTTLPPCGTPAGLTSSSITSTSASLSWNAVSGVISYDLEYKPSNSSTWTSVTGLTTNSYNLTGLTPGTNYDWRVSATCGGGTSPFSTTANFSTTCPVPTGMSTSGISASGATANWNAVPGATSYNFRFRAVGASVWNTYSTAVPSYTMSGLNSGTNYEWQVSTVCASGNSAYTASTNFGTTCLVPTGTTTSNINTSTATLSWNSVSNATGYTLQYKPSASSTWNTLSPSGTSHNLTGLNASTSYDWRVAAICPSGNSAYSSVVTFTTQASCYDPNESNNSSTTATTLAPNSSKTGKLCPSGDVDWFKVTLTSATNLRVILSNLPANYNLERFNSSTFQDGSYNTGVAPETLIVNNAAAGSYWFRVYGQSGAFDNSNDYTITAQTSATPFTREEDEIFSSAIRSSYILRNAYPNPTKGELILELGVVEADKAWIFVHDISGREVLRQQIWLEEGVGSHVLSLEHLPPAIYLVSVLHKQQYQTTKILLQE